MTRPRPKTEPEQVLYGLRRHMRTQGILPMWREIQSGQVDLGCSGAAILKHFGTYTAAILAAGYTPRNHSTAPVVPAKVLLSFRCPGCLGVSHQHRCEHCGAEINAEMAAEGADG